MSKTTVHVSIDTGGITQQVADAAFSSVIYAVASSVFADLQRPNAYFTDRTGEMRRSFKMRKMRYGKGYIIFSDNPHAWYLERGHVEVLFGHKTKEHVPGIYFMRKARNKAKRRLREFISMFDINVSGGRGLHIKKRK